MPKLRAVAATILALAAVAALRHAGSDKCTANHKC